MRKLVRCFVFCAPVSVLVAVAASPTPPKPKTIDFNRDVRPILANNCFKCHGHDPAGVMAGLRLDVRESAISKLQDGKRAIVPGDPGASELVRRINAGEDERMPPPFTHKTLSPADKSTLAKWVEEGAEYKEHWAFVPVVRSTPPPVKNTSWPINDIDKFVLAKMEQAGLKPSPKATKESLLRRVSLDLTGLPPSVRDQDAFLADTSTEAYEKAVDRLLASSRYGERMAMDWLDAARYADSNGYQADYERYQWRWRDWVIAAYNSNMPYDQFIREQIAGDMLPNATLSQKIATGFNRNHRINTEGGVIAEEWRIETVIDRLDTTSTAFLGLTAGCARCHDHKFDPISQKDFYRLFAYFNNVPESGTGEERPVNHPPLLKAPTPEQTQRLAAMDSRIKDWSVQLGKAVAARAPSTDALLDSEKPWRASLSDGLVGRWAFSAANAAPNASVPAPKPVGKPTYDIGRSTGDVSTNNENYLDLGAVGDFDNTSAFSYGGWVYSENGRGAAFAKMDTAADFRGYDAMFIDNVVYVHLINKWPTNALKAITQTQFLPKRWNHLMVTYDGSMKPEGLKVYINGKPSELRFEQNSLTDTLRNSVPLTIGRRTGSEMMLGKVDDFVLFSRVVRPDEVATIAAVDPAKTLLKIPANKRTMEQKRALARMDLLRTDPAFAKLDAKLESAKAERDQLNATIPDLMVMAEMPKPRDCYILKRGEYDKPAEKVDAGTPAFLPPLPKGAPNNRLGLAEWIASPDNPLTARVAVNRFWERLFGTGIVATSEDMGTRAEFPSHPELLDWLATEFVRLKWDTKAMLKEMVMSATYRQQSAFTAESQRIDPQNRLLSHGARFRLQAEAIRDQALAASGLLINKLGGPSVRPYQPKGIWDETNFYGNLRNYREDFGDSLYRRSMYTIWKRTAAPPNMLLFDAPTRETCRIRRARTDTPLQALTLLNDETYLEAARVLAQKSYTDGGPSPSERLAYAFRRVLCRKPSAGEAALLEAGYARHLARYTKDSEAAQSIVKIGEAPVDKRVPVAELAAMTIVCSTLLNLDEAVTKE